LAICLGKKKSWQNDNLQISKVEAGIPAQVVVMYGLSRK